MEHSSVETLQTPTAVPKTEALTEMIAEASVVQVDDGDAPTEAKYRRVEAESGRVEDVANKAVFEEADKGKLRDKRALKTATEMVPSWVLMRRPQWSPSLRPDARRVESSSKDNREKR